MGVKLRLVQYPCRSGWPSGVRGRVQAFAFGADALFCADFVSVFLAAPEDCAPANLGVDMTIANAIPKVVVRRKEQLCMWPPCRLISRWANTTPVELICRRLKTTYFFKLTCRPGRRSTAGSKQKSRIVCIECQSPALRVAG